MKRKLLDFDAIRKDFEKRENYMARYLKTNFKIKERVCISHEMANMDYFVEGDIKHIFKHYLILSNCRTYFEGDPVMYHDEYLISLSTENIVIKIKGEYNGCKVD